MGVNWARPGRLGADVVPSRPGREKRGGGSPCSPGKPHTASSRRNSAAAVSKSPLNSYCCHGTRMKALPHSGESTKPPLNWDILGRDVGHQAVIALGIGHVVHRFGQQRSQLEFIAKRRAVEVVFLEPAELLAVGDNRSSRSSCCCAAPIGPGCECRLKSGLEQVNSPTGEEAAWTTHPFKSLDNGLWGSPGGARVSTWR